MNVDFSCPVELWKYILPSGDMAECSFILNCLSDQDIDTIQMTIYTFDENGQMLGKQLERFQKLTVDENHKINIRFVPQDWNSAIQRIRLTIDRVWFADHSIWRKGVSEMCEYTSNALPMGKELDQLRFIVGEDAVGYPEIQQNAWVCVCGRPNLPDAEKCCRCSRLKRAVFENSSKETVTRLSNIREEKLASSARAAIASNNIVQENSEKQRLAKEKRRKTLTRNVTLIAIAVLLTFGFVFWGIPALRYSAAMQKLNHMEYAVAKQKFEQLGDYQDAPTMVLECDYQQALKLCEQGDAQSLIAAQELFASLNDYKDSEDLKYKAAYALGEAYIASEDYELAADQFAALGDYEDSADRYIEVVYLQANHLMNIESYDTARILFSTIPNYKDADEKEMECVYRMAQESIEAENWESALSELEDIIGYEDADELTKRSYYELAEQHSLQEDYSTAIDLYTAAGDYSDASAKASECRYKLAKILQEGEFLQEALDLLLQIPGYQDADTLAEDCRYMLAIQAAESGDFELAISYYGDAKPQDDLSDECRELLGDCHYQLAQKALDSGDREAAEAELENAADYGKAQDELIKLRYSLAEAAFESKEYENALNRYLALDGYKNSTARIKACRYALAEQALSEGNYDRAIELYTLLKSYKDSEDLLKEAKYQKAMMLYGAGDAEGALQFLKDAGNKKSKLAMQEIYREQGDKLMEAGSYEAAAEQYAQIDTKEGKALYQSAVYQWADQLKNEGNYIDAAKLFLSLGTYEDAEAQKDECATLYWGNALEDAQQYIRQGEYALALAAMDGIDLDQLSELYPDLSEMVQEASYLYAETLYNSGKPYEAIPYYRSAGSYRKADSEKLERKPYLILGEWTTDEGVKAVFSSDYTCTIGGETLYFKVSGYSLYTGESLDSLSLTHKLSKLTETELVLRDLRQAKEIVSFFTRVGDWSVSTLAISETVPPEAETEPESDTESEAAEVESEAAEVESEAEETEAESDSAIEPETEPESVLETAQPEGVESVDI